jgi:hypothetical protein
MVVSLLKLGLLGCGLQPFGSHSKSEILLSPKSISGIEILTYNQPVHFCQTRYNFLSAAKSFNNSGIHKALGQCLFMAVIEGHSFF